jgi:hypothetical protein
MENGKTGLWSWWAGEVVGIDRSNASPGIFENNVTSLM